ncbi:MAG: cell division protein FtsA [Patescibacteria group bacterium]
MRFSSSKKQLGVVFDVGTVSVSATLFELHEPNGKAHILKTFRRFHQASLRQDAMHFSKSTITQFSSVVDDIKAHLKGAAMPMYYEVGLSSIFYLGKTVRFAGTNDRPVVLTEARLQQYFQEGTQEFVNELKRTDVVIFETILMRSLLNGYPIERPIGRASEQVELFVRFSATSQELYTRLTEILKATNAAASINFSSFPVSSWFLVRNTLPYDRPLLLVDIGGEITEVTFIHDGMIIDVQTLPFGVLNILLRIAELEQMDIEHAFSLLKSYTDGSLADDAKKRVHDIIRRELKTWEQVFERVWQRASRDMMINIQMYFLGGGALVEELKSAVAPPLLHPDIAKGLTVSLMAPDQFKDRFGTFCCFDGPGDFGLMSLILNKRV